MSASFFLDGENLSYEKFNPFTHRQLFFKGGGDPDTSVKDTEDAKQLAKIAVERTTRYKETFQPVENAYLAEVDNLNSESKQQEGANVAVGNTESAFAGKLQEDVQAMQGAGVNMNSGVVNEAINTNSIEKGAARGQNVNMTQQAIQDSHVKGLQGVVAMGNGQSAEAIKGMGEISSYSSQQAKDDAVSSFNNTSARNEAVGTAVGMAYGGYKAINDKSGDE